MKIALISTPTRTAAPNTIMPLGIMYLASYLEKEGHTTRIIDVAKTRQSNSTTISELSKFAPDLIGIGGIITAFRFIKELVTDLKKAFPNIPVVIGGHVTLDTQDILIQSVGCDYTVTGWGEKPLTHLVKHLEKKRDINNIPGLSYLKGDKIVSNPCDTKFSNMDDIPLPAYNQIDMEYYLTVVKKNPRLETYLAKTGKAPPPMRTAVVIGARGCTNQCSFCIHEFGYKGFWVHSKEYILNNIRFLYEEHGARVFLIGEDLFLYSAKQATNLANSMNNNFPDAYFFCSARADYVLNQGLADILKDSNCFYLGFGFESGCDEILRILYKRSTRDTNINAYKAISKTHIVPACSFMVGTPGETKRTVKETISAIKDANVTEATAFFTTPYPGSRLFRWCTEQGLIKDTESYLDFISDRNAAEFSINFTPYPDIIVKMMQILIHRAIRDNRVKTDKSVRYSIKSLIFHHLVIPTLFESYFLLRRLLSVLLPKYRRDTINLVLNDKGTIKLSTD